jgi:hypothetical protein
MLYLDNYYLPILRKILPNKIYTIGCVLIIALLNYLFFVKTKNFLKYNFSKSKIGKIIIILYFILIGILFFYIVDLHSEKIFKERKKVRIESTQ